MISEAVVIEESVTIDWNSRSDYHFQNPFQVEITRLAPPKKRCSCCFCKAKEDPEFPSYAVQEEEDARGYPDDDFQEPGMILAQISMVSDLEAPPERPQRKRRTRIPDKPNMSLSLWSILKNAVGKDLSKIPIPVNFCEPISMLQRLTEDFEYSEILDTAAMCDDTCEQLAMVAAFTVSSYASCSVRTAKPFNPLLGETYECDRTDDKGWRCITEQVKHHPPTVAQHCEGKGWVMYQDFTMKSKFKGNYLELTPFGVAVIVFKSGQCYSWRKVTSYVHNLVIGKLYLDNDGEMEINNHVTGDKCILKYHASSWREQKKVTGIVQTKEEIIKWVLNGFWDKSVECQEVKEQKLVDGKSDPSLRLITKLGTVKRFWARNALPAGSDKFYFFTEFACQLNEPEDGTAPTDSRFRPDIRLMENTKWEDANIEKQRLEEKQRSSRKIRQAAAGAKGDDDPFEPTWFKKQKDPISGMTVHIYGGDYWLKKEKQDWSKCPSIF